MELLFHGQPGVTFCISISRTGILWPCERLLKMNGGGRQRLDKGAAISQGGFGQASVSLQVGLWERNRKAEEGKATG